MRNLGFQPKSTLASNRNHSMPFTEISSTCVHVYTNFFPYPFPVLFLVGLTAVCKLRSWLVEQKQGKAV